MGDTPVPVPAGATFGPAIQDSQSQAVPVPVGATFGPPIQGDSASGQTAPGTGAFNDAVQRATDEFTSRLGIPKDWSIGALVQGAKDKWAAEQEKVKAEADMAANAIQNIKQGNYGQAAEFLLGHIAKQVSPIPGIVESAKNEIAPVVSNVKQGKLAEAAGDVMATTAKVAPALVGAPEIEGLEGAEAGAADANAATHVLDRATGKISPIQQVLKGEKVAQGPAQSALRGAAGAGEEGGVRTLLDEPIAAVAKTERATYDALNKASGTDLKALYDHAEEVQDALDDPTNIAQKSALQADLKTTQDQIAQGEANAVKNGVDPSVLDKAKGLTQERYAKEALKQKLFNNESVVEGDTRFKEPETINVKAAIRQAQNLDKPSRFAPEGTPTRLRQALGEDGANKLLQGLYDAQKAGKTAIGIRDKIWTGIKIAGLGGGLIGGAKEVAKLF